MAKKIRVYELARELGLTNKEALDLCLSLGMGVKSHSSSIEEAQADRARRKADREGLRRPVTPVEEAEPQGTPGGVKAASIAARSPELASSSAQGSARAPAGGPGVSAGLEPVRSGQMATTGGALSESLEDATALRPAGSSSEPGAITEPPVTLGQSPKPAEPPAMPGDGGADFHRLVRSKPASQRGELSGQSALRTGGTSHPGPTAGSQVRSERAQHSAQAPTGKPALSGESDSAPAGSGPEVELLSPAASVPASAKQAQKSSLGDVSADLSDTGLLSPPGNAPATKPSPSRPSSAQPAVTKSTASSPGGDRVEGQAGTKAPAPGRPGDLRSRPPVGPSGRPIPPPPGTRPPVGLSGRPIPPPPGMGGRRPTPPQSSPGRQGSWSSGPVGSRPSGSGGRSSTGSSSAGGRSAGPSSRPGGASSGPSGRPGSFGRGPIAPPPPGSTRQGQGGARGRQPQRRPRRRRRTLEELEPTQLTSYMPSDAPVPDHEVILERGSTAQDVGPRLNRSAGDVIRFLLLQGEMVTATQSLTDDMIELFAAEIGADIVLVDPGQEEEAALRAKYFSDEEDPERLRPCPAVITVMGHVDHGKTLLLDRIRQADVAAHEAGGITQHIGAYQVDLRGHKLTFIDTPGHEAFTAMRARGAEVTDIVVLVVAADDGVMPQTVEAINHAKAADVPVVVAINKIDREDADPTRVLQQLSEHGLVPETWGGDTITVEVSALESLGIEDLLEQLAVLSEVLEIQADPEARVRGVVLEANLDIGRGPVATVLVQSGTLRVGDDLVAGAAWGRVKAMIDDRGEMVKEAPPSTPVQVLGFSEPPSAGDEVRAVPDQATARSIGESRARRMRMMGHAGPASVAPGARLEDLFEQIQRGETATLNLILKADVQGSLEAVTESLRKLERDEVKLTFVHRAVGGITENDVQLAAASNATIIGFNVRPDRRARELAAERGVDMRTYEIIYKLIEDMESAMVGMLSPTFEEVVTGEAEVREVFRVPRVGAVAGCYVRNGTITRGSKVRFLRDGVVIWHGTITSLKRFKEDAREVASGFECGVGLSDFQDLKEGDVIETYEEREVPRV